MIQTPDQALNEMNNFLQKHAGDSDPMWKLFDNNYQIKNKCSAHRLIQAKQELKYWIEKRQANGNYKPLALTELDHWFAKRRKLQKKNNFN